MPSRKVGRQNNVTANGRQPTISPRNNVTEQEAASYDSAVEDREDDTEVIYPRKVQPSESPPTPQTRRAAPNLSPSYLLSASPPSGLRVHEQYSNDWTRNIHDNGVRIGVSPPTNGFANDPHHGSSSPLPAGRYRPLSSPSPTSPFGSSPTHMSPHIKDRRSSFASHGRSTDFVEAPPPHMPQAHFHVVPQLPGLGPRQSTGRLAGSNGYFCGFDTFGSAPSGSAKAPNVVLVGCEGGLSIYRVSQRTTEIVGRIEGLRGAVVGAKILPCTLRTDPCSDVRPLIVLILHGPIIKEPKESENAIAGDEGISGMDTAPDSVDQKLNTPRPYSVHGASKAGNIEQYQTTVEVYSIKTCRYIGTLYTSPAVDTLCSVTSRLFRPPPPVGDLKVDACGRYVTVSSGVSGEVFVFSSFNAPSSNNTQPFRCIGKYWTTVRTTQRSSKGAASIADQNGRSSVGIEGESVPLMSLSARWLAVVAPPSSSLFSINGTPLLSDSNPDPPGIKVLNAPPLPVLNCATDVPEGDGFIEKLTRQATQELRKGAQWVSEQGMQAWNSYWNGTSFVTKQAGGRVANGDRQQDPQPLFPPTHALADDMLPQSSEPVLVSIVDLQKLVDNDERKIKNPLVPLATFTLRDGCSFLSFAPNGLSLLSSNQKGDASTVWDLLCMHYSKLRTTGPAARQHSNKFPHVRQIARFTRKTESSTVDVLWSTDRPDRIAILTEAGTAHLHLIPSSAYVWPPLPRITPSVRPVSRVHESPATFIVEPADNGFVGGLRSGWASLNGKLSAVRTRSGSNSYIPTLSSLAAAPTAARAVGSRAVKAGLKQSIGVATDGLHHIRHAEDSKLRFPANAHGSPGTVRWLSGKQQGSIALVANGVVRIHKVEVARAVSGQNKRTKLSLAVLRKSALEYTLPRISDCFLPPAVLAVIEPNSTDRDCGKQGPHGFWTLKPRAAYRRLSSTARRERHDPSKHGEIRSNPPYQPFHTDPRVSMSVLTSNSESQGLGAFDSPTHSTLLSGDAEEDMLLIFGRPYVPRKQIISNSHQRLIGPGTGDGDEFDQGLTDQDLDMAADRLQSELIIRSTEEGELEQLVITKKGRRSTTGEDEWFEDEADLIDFARNRV
ncbi:hypothetical protein LTR50_007297 [Elasticomyces elasticus]|nr:hypothetical protein LTR50_007297 [Elasticomyces elasticus]